METHKSFLQFVAEEQAKIINQFENPEHPLVVEHAAVLNLIKQRMLSTQLHVMYSQSNWQTADEARLGERYSLDKWPIEKVTQFEATTELRLHNELKVYLTEVGEGEVGIFEMGWMIPVKRATDCNY